MSLNANSSIGALDISSGALAVNTESTLSVAGGLNLSGGTLSGSGNVEVGGQFAWTGGTVSGAGSFSTASAQFGGGLKQLDGRTMTVSGALNFGGTNWLDMSNGATLTVNGLATLNTSAISTSFFGINSVSGAASTVNFLGGITKLGAQPFDLAVQANTAGTVRSQAGQLAFDAGFTGAGGGTHTNTNFIADAGAEISFSRGTHTVNGNVSFGGAGQTHIWANGTPAQFVAGTSGTLTNNGLLLIDTGATLGVDLTNAGTLTFGNSTVAGNLNNQGTLNASSGTTDLSGSLSSTGASSVVNINGGTLSGTGSITAAVLNLSGGSLDGTGNLTVTDDFVQTGGSVGGGYQQLILTHQGDALIPQSYSAKDTFALAASGTITLDGKTLVAPNVILYGGTGLTLKSSTLGVPSLVNASTSLNVTTPGALVLDGTNGQAKLLSATGTIIMNVGSVQVIAGAYPASIDPTTLNLTATGDIVLSGGSSPSATAKISGNNVTVSGANIILNGGTGSDSFAVIEATTGSAVVTASNAIIMNPGAGTNADASIVAPQGTLTITAASCTGCITLGADPLPNQQTDLGLFGSSVVLNIPTPVQTDTTPFLIDNSIIYAASLAQDGGQANTDYLQQPQEEEEKKDDKDTATTGSNQNDGKQKPKLPICM